MLKFRKHFATFVFALLSLLMLTGFSNVYAKDQTSNIQQYSDNIVNITVPSEMNISFNNQGKATISQFTINNNNLVNLNIDSLNVTGNSWSLIPWNNKPNGNQIAMKLENKELSSTNINNFDGLYVPKNGSKTLNFQVKDRIFKDNVSKQNAFNFNFNFSLGQETFKVNFDTQGGTAVNYISAKNGETITLPSANSSTKTGYTLQYWQINGKNYTPGSSYIVPIGDSTFKAIWSANTYTYNVEYVSSSGKSLGTSTISAKYGETKSVSAPAKTGYTTPVSQNVIFDSVNPKTVTFTYPIVNYSIGYTLNNGTITGNPTSYNIESATITLKNPTRTGYIFTGWTGSNGTTPQTSVSITSGSTGNKSYTANWKINTYTLTYNANGGSVSPTSKSLIYGSQYGTLPTPTKTGYTFTGWYTASSGGTKVSSTTTIGASNVTIYAQWRANKLTVNYYPNGGTPTGSEFINNGQDKPMLTQTGTYGSKWNADNGLHDPTESRIKRVGYTQNGYNTQANGSGRAVDYATLIYAQDIEPSLKDGDKTLNIYVQWKPNTYTYNIKYVSSSGKSLGTSTVRGVYGSSTTVNAPSKNGYTKPAGQTVKFDNVNAKTITFTYTPINYKIIYNIESLSGFIGINSSNTYFPTTGGSTPNFYNTYSGYIDSSTETLFFPFYSETVKWTFNGVQKPEFNGMSVIDLPDEYKNTRLDIKIEWVDPNNTQSHEGWFVLHGWSESIPTQYNIESTFTLPDGSPNDSKYQFKGWYDNSSFNGNSITSMTGMYGDKILYPKLEALQQAQKPTVTAINTLKFNNDYNSWYYTSGSLGANASVTDGGKLTYTWDMYWYTLGTVNGAGGTVQPVKRKITGIPSSMNQWSPYIYFNMDNWWQNSEVDPSQYGPTNDNIAGYITVTNTLPNGSSSSTRIWVGDTSYQNMYNKAPLGSSVAYTSFVNKSINNIDIIDGLIDSIPNGIEQIEPNTELIKPNEDKSIEENNLNSNSDKGTEQ